MLQRLSEMSKQPAHFSAKMTLYLCLSRFCCRPEQGKVSPNSLQIKHYETTNLKRELSNGALRKTWKKSVLAKLNRILNI